MRELPWRGKELDGPPHRLYDGIEYKEYWNGSRKNKLNELEHSIVCHMLPKSGRRIIDIGCGFGRLADCYIGRFQQVIMVDGSMTQLRQAYKTTRGEGIYIAADALHLPFSTATFDAVLMIRVYQHFSDSLACLTELNRLLCKDGRLIFNYANKQRASSVIRWLKGASTENPMTLEPGEMGSSYYSHHPKSVHRMLREVGFSGMKYYGAGVMDWLTDKIGPTGKWIPSGKYLAPFFGGTKVAPWIFCAATARRNPSLINIERISDLLQCPSCGGRVSDEKRGYLCLSCSKYYPVEDGIIDLRV